MDIGTHTGRMQREHQDGHLQAMEMGGVTGIFLIALQETNIANTLILDFQLLQLLDNKFQFVTAALEN